MTLARGRFQSPRDSLLYSWSDFPLSSCGLHLPKKEIVALKRSYLLLLAAAVLFSALPILAQNTGSPENLPANFKKVSTLVHLPDWLPGLGTLYVDPASLPAGPYLGYNHSGKLVNVIYMIPIKDMSQHKNWNDLGQNISQLDMKVDHTSILYNPGHPGVQEPHYHFIEWFITPAQEKQEMK